MLDLAWSEIALIAVVALVVIGPKDLPEAVKGVARGIQKLRRMAGEFQSQVDEVAKDAGVQDLRQSIADIRRFDLKGQIEKAVDKDGALRDTFSKNPLEQAASDPLKPDTLAPAPWEPPATMAPGDAPAFVPPGVAVATAPFVPRPKTAEEVAAAEVKPAEAAGTGAAAPASAEAASSEPVTAAAPAVPPAFVPPNVSSDAAKPVA